MKIMNPLLFLLAQATHREMVQQLQYLKAENRILRDRLPKHIKTTPKERAILLKYGKPLGAAIKALITIVTSQTFFRWVREEDKQAAHQPLKRRRTPEHIRALVVRIARQTGWGYTRVLGELRKLGISRISRGTIQNILEAHHINPSPKRSGTLWADFIKRHAETLWACDFFTKNVWTPLGLQKFHILALINIGSRQVRILGITATPDQYWMVQRAQEVADFFKAQVKRPTALFHDRDKRFIYGFNPTLQDKGIPVQPVPAYSPNLNAYMERWIQSIKYECLNHFVVFGESHLKYLVDEYVTWYNTVRPHQGKGNRPLIKPHRSAMIPDDWRLDDIVCESRLGGLLKHYRYAA